MAPRLGEELKSRRERLGLTQRAVAEQLGVQRASLAQWEGGRHLPSAEHTQRLDEIYGARGALVALADGARRGGILPSPRAFRSVGDVFADVARALVDKMHKDPEGRPLGWAHNLVGNRPTPLSTAFVIRTLQQIDDAQVDLHALGRALVERRNDGGWTNRVVLQGRPEVTSVVLSALARLGMLTDVDSEIEKLGQSVDDLTRSRPYVLSVVLEAVLAIRPEARFVDDLVDALLEARMPVGDALLWPANAAAPPELLEPSLAHTARATTVLRLARGARSRTDVDEAVDMGTRWIVARSKEDDGTTELLEPDPGNKAADISVNHFTAAWVVRALAGRDGVPPQRLNAAVKTVWNTYSPSHHLWVWRADGRLPSWMTHDAVAALRALAGAAVSSPVPLDIGAPAAGTATPTAAGEQRRSLR
ncbi:helix-turn-helix domain-containing protein [Pseudonocardia sp. CA-142604]|uniref:helix-turn-helix domain-containing protein n=1 Tax=Pseudonocardia sp. CA-142604 TaxID=3240024 RepID=UPI003D8E4867